MGLAVGPEGGWGNTLGRRKYGGGGVVGARGGWGLVGRMGGPYGAVVKAHACLAVDESRSRLAARCVSFYQVVCLSVCLCHLRGPWCTADLVDKSDRT